MHSTPLPVDQLLKTHDQLERMLTREEEEAVRQLRRTGLPMEVTEYTRGKLALIEKARRLIFRPDPSDKVESAQALGVDLYT